MKCFAVRVIIVISIVFATYAAVGTRQYGENCVNSLIAGLGFGKESETCNWDNNLVCLGSKCACNPAGFVYQNGLLGVDVLGGGCRLRANFPCSFSKTACVVNSKCNTVCLCDTGYQMDRFGKCVSAGGDGIDININVLSGSKV
ncbi:uncharacterized protein LOC110857674 [Folsomia candida]|uniref:EB domain-containing protein n=1 Tax=Folsomia candida TaxID=158441 RepID=A0A226DGY3_FOLCA|nr:uncharacterized protein LOC110857674 [Folsomia candida]OXA44410.1 hypothetical protein Fcan01_20953 [Folsomia candida]